MVKDMRWGPTPRWYMETPEDYHMRVPKGFLRCVVFLAVDVLGDTEIPIKRPIGTGFFVHVPSERYPHQISHRYIVTARHVAENLSPPFFIGMNTVDGEAVYLTSQQNTHWWQHPEDGVTDVAVIPFAPSEQTVRYDWIDIDMLLSEDKFTEKGRFSLIEYVGVGDEVLMTGLFAKVTGRRQNIPIARMGTIAMLPFEPIPIDYKDRSSKDMEAYLIESHSVGGLSGSPVFGWTRVSVDYPQAYLLGLISGHWDISPPSSTHSQGANGRVVEDLAQANEAINRGISIVVPAKKIREILYQEELVEMRAQSDEMYIRENLPTLDQDG